MSIYASLNSSTSFSGVLPVANGGTGDSTLTAHGVLIGEGTNPVAVTAAGTTGQVLIGSTGADPAFGALGVNSGLTAHGVLVAENNSAFVATAAGTSGQLLQSKGAAADPAYTTATYPATTTAFQLLASTAANTVGEITAGATGTVLTGVTGAVPAFSATPSVTSITLGGGTALGSYVQNTYTPVLTFGGGSTGITYSTQSGEYTQVGNLVFFNIFLILTNKGSSTGTARISLPINTGGAITFAAAAYWTNINLAASYSAVGGYTQSNLLNLDQNGDNNTSTTLLDTDFANNSAIGISGFYFTS